MKAGIAHVNGTSLYFETRGDGSPLVLISGGGTLDRRAWDDQFAAFSRNYKVIRYDVRGIGNSARPQRPFSHSQDLYALLQFLGVRKARLVGLSFGGSIAIDFALERPEMVDGLILAATGTSSDAKAESNMRSLAAVSSMVATEGLPHVIELILNSGLLISKENLAAREKVRQIYLDNRDVFMSGFPLVELWQPVEPPASQRLPDIRVPALIVVPENDSPAYKTIVDGLASTIDGAQKVVIAGAAHLVNLDRPEEFNQAVLEFLSQR